MAIDSRIALIMSTNVISVEPDSSVEDVARQLWQNNISTLPVVEDGRVIGIITDYDLITRETEYKAPLYVTFLEAYFHIPGTGDDDQLRRILAISARDLMTTPAITVSPDTIVHEVATLMHDKHLNALPVVEPGDTLVGIVSRADIVRLMVADEDLYERTHPNDQ